MLSSQVAGSEFNTGGGSNLPADDDEEDDGSVLLRVTSMDDEKDIQDAPVLPDFSQAPDGKPSF